MRRRLTTLTNEDFNNITKNVLNQNGTNLCVPISVSILLRWTIKHDLQVEDLLMNHHYSLERILTALTMVIYPRSLAGLNLNPNKIEQEFQENEIDLLLRRIKYETYLNKSGWQIIRDLCIGQRGSFEFSVGFTLLRTIQS